MRSRVLLQLMASETAIPDYSDPEYVIWRNAQGNIHRDFGPAVLYARGAQEWWQNGRLHREDGPALIDVDGTRLWFRNGQRHRDDGPAVTDDVGQQQWWIDGERIR